MKRCQKKQKKKILEALADNNKQCCCLTLYGYAHTHKFLSYILNCANKFERISLGICNKTQITTKLRNRREMAESSQMFLLMKI